MTERVMTWDEMQAAFPSDDTMWPGYYYTDGPPPFNHGKRAHKPPDWPHDRKCWCGAKRHRPRARFRLRHKKRPICATPTDAAKSPQKSGSPTDGEQ